jgi:phage-related protein
MSSLPASILQEVERPHGRSPLIWLAEIEVSPATPSAHQQLFRFTTYHRDVEWPLSAPLQTIWNPMQMEVGNLELSGEGDLPHLDLAFGNASRFAMRYLHAYDGLVGRPVTTWLLTEAGLSIAYPNQESLKPWQWEVQGCVANATTITLTLGTANLFHAKSPPQRYVPARCRHIPFGGPACGYIVNAAAAFTTCDKTFANCIARGNDEVARNLPRLHPRRFGGFPGIPQEPR